MDEFRQTENNMKVTGDTENIADREHKSASQKIDKDDTLFTSATSEMPA